MGNIDIAAMITLANSFAGALIPLFSVFGVVTGLILIRSAAMELMGKNSRGEDGPNFSAVCGRLLIAGVFFQFAVSVGWTTSLFGGTQTSTRAAMALVINTSNPVWDSVMDASFLWLQLIGYAAVFRGFIKWNAAVGGDNNGNGKDEFWAGMWHIVGGAVLVNLGG